ncbi:MAG: hypothetical protein VBE63_21420 [Lamprobacter sp.]|uniref:hypothetical protein n=1 Tax=Lamprobacter sp. TaxID=3100796 RepID=UPI002B25AA10|nr:hypothetical protein [Lamprobacter sp.]MEA3642481.1 hypothetical protein [Lamprobacter sp.]
MDHRIFELYWRGDLKIALTPRDVQGSALQNRIQAIHFLNEAFALFYRCRQGIAQCSDSTMRKRLTQTLEAAASNGPGRNACDDLKEAIAHALALKSRDGYAAPYQWRDLTLQSYQSFGFHQQMAFTAVGGRRPTVWQQGDVISAKAAVRFLEEIDQHVSELQARFARIEQRWDQVHRLGLRLQRSRLRPTAGEWKMLGATLWSIGRTVFDSQSALWLSGSGIDARFNHTTACLGSGTTVLGVGHRLEALASRMRKGGATSGHLKEALELLCVLGTFYARALDVIPGAKFWINRVEARRWNELRLLADVSPATRLTEINDGQEFLSGHTAKRGFPMLGHYRETLNQGLL